LLLDDFVTDFDQIRLSRCMEVLKRSPYQIFLTCPQGSVEFLKSNAPIFDWIVLT